MSASVLGKVPARARRVDVDDLVALATALEEQRAGSGGTTGFQGADEVVRVVRVRLLDDAFLPVDGGQDFDWGKGSVPLAMDVVGLIPPSVVDRGEPACAARQGGRRLPHGRCGRECPSCGPYRPEFDSMRSESSTLRIRPGS